MILFKLFDIMIIFEGIQSDSSPASVDGPGSSINLSRILAHQKSNQFSDVLSAAECSRGLFFLDQSARGLFDGDVIAFCDNFNLLLNEGGQDEAGADGIDSDSLLGVFKGNCLGEAHDSVFRGDVCGLVDRGNESVNRGDVDDSAPSGLLHVGECGFGEVEG